MPGGRQLTDERCGGTGWSQDSLRCRPFLPRLPLSHFPSKSEPAALAPQPLMRLLPHTGHMDLQSLAGPRQLLPSTQDQWAAAGHQPQPTV